MQGKFERFGSKIGSIVDEKQSAYGDSFGKSAIIMQELLRDYYDYRHEAYMIPLGLLPHLLTIVRMIDKLNRIVANPSGDRMGESPYVDIAGYALIAAGMAEEERSENDVTWAWEEKHK